LRAQNICDILDLHRKTETGRTRKMYAQPPKKMLTLNIPDILNRCTDGNHRLSQKEIVDLLRTEYGMTVDRKAVKRNPERFTAIEPLFLRNRSEVGCWRTKWGRFFRLTGRLHTFSTI
jgi:hypothetical protein